MAEKVTSSSPPEVKESPRCQLQGIESKSNVMVVFTCHFIPSGRDRRLSDGSYPGTRSFVPTLSPDIIYNYRHVMLLHSGMHIACLCRYHAFFCV